VTATAAPVSAAATADRRAIVADLHAAFMDDPVLGWVFPDEEHRRRYGMHFFAMHARRLIPQGLAWRADGGSALWALPDQWRESPWDDLRLAAASLPGVWRRAPLVGRGMLALEARHPEEPHLYLAVIGVRPEVQGRGLGSALLRPGLSYADEHGLPAYLESSNIRNVPLYERHGFRVTGEHHQPAGPTMWLMWRRANAQT
jgi:ribosomal protein S18 acetylase RimI-like enzyme